MEMGAFKSATDVLYHLHGKGKGESITLLGRVAAQRVTLVKKKSWLAVVKI